MSRQLDDWLRGYLQYVEYSEAPHHFHFWSGISAIAGALRRKVYIDQIYFRWSPNFYIILVAPSGIATKSTVMDIAMDMLKEIQSVHFGPNSMTWQALLPKLQAAQEQVLTPDGDYETQSCLTFAASELQTLIKFDDVTMLAVLTDLWDGKAGAWEKATATMGNASVINPWLNIIACITPSNLTSSIPRAAIGGGFTSRCVFVYGDKKRQLLAYPKREAKKRAGLAKIQALRAALVHDLEEISCISGEYELDQEAEDFGTVWYEKIYREPPSHLLINNFDGYLARKQGHVHKVAMVVAAAYKNERVITKEDLVKAIALVDSLESDMVQVFSHIKSDASGSKVEDILQIMRIYKRIARPVLYRMVFNRMAMTKQDFDTIISSACEAGILKAGAGLMLEVNQTEPTENRLNTLSKEE